MCCDPGVWRIAFCDFPVKNHKVQSRTTDTILCAGSNFIGCYLSDFTKLFSVTPTGVINALLSVFNPDLLYMEWISNDSLSLIIAASVEGYKYLGLYMVIFYAALIGIPKELDEAAIMDGANVIQQYRYVKIPYIRPVIIANCILVLNGSLRSFDISYLLTKGGPGNSSELMSTYMYKQAFTSMKYGYGSAVAMVIVAICLIVGFLFRRFTERGGEE